MKFILVILFMTAPLIVAESFELPPAKQAIKDRYERERNEGARLPVPKDPLNGKTIVQRHERVHLKKGSTSISLFGKIANPPDYSSFPKDQYVFRARGGQVMTIKLTSQGDAYFTVHLDSEETLGRGPYLGAVLPKSGDYIVTVGANISSCSYRLDVDFPIEKPKPCRASDLKMSEVAEDGATAMWVTSFDLTNISSITCAVLGAPSVQIKPPKGEIYDLPLDAENVEGNKMNQAKFLLPQTSFSVRSTYIWRCGDMDLPLPIAKNVIWIVTLPKTKEKIETEPFDMEFAPCEVLRHGWPARESQ